MTNYAIQSSLALSFDEALARAPDALAKEGFGVLTQVDVQGSLRKASIAVSSLSNIWRL